MENRKWYHVMHDLIEKQPLSLSLLGLIPALAVTTSFEGAFGFGLIVILVLLLSTLIVGGLKRVIPNHLVWIVSIIVVTTIVTVFQLLSEAFFSGLYHYLGISLSLIAVNSIVMIHTIQLDSNKKNSYLYNLKNAVILGCVLACGLVILGGFREILGTGGLTFGEYLPFPNATFLPLQKFKLPIFLHEASGLISLGFLLAIVVAVHQKRVIEEGGE